MAAETVVTPEVLTGEARFILQHIANGARDGLSNHMADVRDALANAVTLDFADYLKFLKKFNYITLNRTEHTLGLTEDGARVVEGYDGERFTLEIGDYFSHRLTGAHPTVEIADDVAAPSGRSGLHGTRYVKYEEIGSGGLGTVFRGKHTTLGTEVAIKEIKDLFGFFSFLERNEVAERLETAVTGQAGLHHPAIVEILDLDPDVAHPFFVMSLCPGGSLRDALDRRVGKGLPEAVVLRWLLQALYGLKVAHAADLVHGNLKPENLLLDAQGNLRIGDLGLASVLEVDASRHASLPNVFLSTTSMSYLSPEQLAREDVGPDSDLYSLGIVLYELLLGQPPGRRAPLPTGVDKSLSKGVDTLFDRLTRDKRSERFPDVDAVLDAFYEAFDDGRFAKAGELLLYTEPPSLGPEDAKASETKKPADTKKADKKAKKRSNPPQDEPAPEKSEAAPAAEDAS